MAQWNTNTVPKCETRKHSDEVLVTVVLDDNYADALAITAIGSMGQVTNVTTMAVDLNKYKTIIVNKDGKVEVKE